MWIYYQCEVFQIFIMHSLCLSHPTLTVHIKETESSNFGCTQKGVLEILGEGLVTRGLVEVETWISFILWCLMVHVRGVLPSTGPIIRRLRV